MGSGAIEPQEFLAIGKAVKAASVKGGEWTEEMSAKAMARVDTDGGGSIDVDEFCDFFVKTMPKNRTHEQFRKLMTRYMAAAIAGRASYYFEEGKALREAAEAEEPESHKVKVSADAHAEAQKRSEMYIHKQERHLKRRCQYARAAEYAAEYASAVCATCTQRPRRSSNFSVSAKSTLAYSSVLTRPLRTLSAHTASPASRISSTRSTPSAQPS